MTMTSARDPIGRTRREFLAAAGKAGLVGAAAFGIGGRPDVLAAAGSEEINYPKGKAEHCIFVWLGGGAAHVDTWDPKRLGDGRKVPGSAYAAIDTAIGGVQVCEHLKHCAKLLDRFALLRTLNHDVVDEHAAATNRLHTGRPTNGTVVYPSIGSIVAHERGSAAEGIPAYVVIGYPNVTRGPGFLGAKYGYVYLTDTEAGPSGLTPPADVAPPRRARREALLEGLRSVFQAQHPGEAAIADYAAAGREAARLAGPAFL